MSALRSYLALRSPRMGALGQELLPLMLVALWLLNLADFALTRYGMWLGFAVESNDIMAQLFRSGTWVAAAFKIGIVTAGCLLLWRLRRYRTALVAAVTLAFIFAALVTYEVLWITSF
jgi:hypothetical protein